MGGIQTKKFMVESDCQVVVHAINSAVNIMSPFGTTIIMYCGYEATFLYILLRDEGISQLITYHVCVVLFQMVVSARIMLLLI